MAEPPGRAEGGPAGKAACAFESASQATPQRPGDEQRSTEPSRTSRRIKPLLLVLSLR